MPAVSRKLPAKPVPPPAADSSASRPNAAASPFLAGCDDDDDDFVSPPSASWARPLKPCTGIGGAASLRPCKKLKPSRSSAAKENRSVAGGPTEKVVAESLRAAETLAAGSKANSGGPHRKDMMGGEIRGVSRYGSHGSKLGRSVKKASDRYGNCKSTFSSSESRVSVLGATCDLGGGHCEEAKAIGFKDCTSILDEGQSTVKVKGSEAPEAEGGNRSRLIETGLLESDANHEFAIADSRVFENLGSEAQNLDSEPCNLVSQERKVATGHSVTLESEIVENKLSGPEACKENYSNSSESELLQSQTPHDFEGGCYENFEIGTQLNELINLCMEDTCDTKSFKLDNQVLCPVCGSDVSDLNEELRQLHTNNCLDVPAKYEWEMKLVEWGYKENGESNPVHQNELPAAKSVENNSVVEWLRNLGLSKYEEIFIREEIDWETLQRLTEEDLLGMGITSLGPRKKIIHALGEIRKKKDQINDIEADFSNAVSTKKAKLPINGNKLITQYFQCSSFDQRQRVSKVNKPYNIKEQTNASIKIASKRSRVVKGKAKDTPLWCCVPGTPFRVDAFRYLRGDCCHWFLTHFHIDHYQGLTRSFCHGKIYCSSITASLVHHKIGIPWDRLHVLPMNEKITIAGVNLTCFDANHCPGSIIILFEPPNCKAVLHTGDFRFSSEMANNPILQSSHIHTLILDTTYCNPRYDFPSQEVVIQFVIEAIQAEAFNPKTLFLIGSYTIGKERLFMEVARLLKKKIYVGAAKLQILKHLDLPQEIMHWFTANEAESHIHVVPMWTLASFKRMKFLSNQYAGRFDLIVAFCPTGWSFGKGRKRTPGKRWQQGSIIRYEVPYSEHSSFTELQEFVKFISPEHIIPSVNNDGPESANTMLAQLLNES